MRDCTKCELHTQARSVCIPGSGPKDAKVVIVGQNPGGTEDRDGAVFVGASGEELTRYLTTAGFSREDVYVTNAVKCHSRNNTTPSPKHVKACREYLQAEIDEIKPTIVIALGNTALQALTGGSGIQKQRGSITELHTSYGPNAVKVLPTYHPAAAMRTPMFDAVIQADFNKASGIMGIKTFNQIPAPWLYCREESYDMIFGNGEWIGFDIETTGLNPYLPNAGLLTIAVDDGSPSVSVGRESMGVALGRKLERYPRVVGHNSRGFDAPYLKALFGIDIDCHDTQLMAYIDDETQQLSLEALAVRYLGVAPWKDDVYWKFDTFLQTQTEKQWDDLAQYNARDTRYTRELAKVLERNLRANNQWTVYDKVLRPTTWSTQMLTRNGMYISVENALAGRAERVVHRDDALAKLKEIALQFGNRNFNPASPLQVGKLLFETEGFWGLQQMKPVSLTKSGNPSTDELSIRTLALKKPIPFLMELLRYRGAAKAISTYFDPYLKIAAESPDGRAHPEYTITFTDTGRLSAFNPNSQNIPRDPALRAIIAAPPGRLRAQVDYSQLEMRVMAFESRCPGLLKAFQTGQDTHRLMAARITGKASRPETVTKEERSNAKPVNFMFLYGAEEWTFMSTMLKDYEKYVPYPEAKKTRDAFFNQWPGLEAFYDRVYEECRAHGYVTSFTGRRRHLPNIYAGLDNVRVEALRMAINFRIQSPANDAALIALNMIREAGYFITDSVHDSIGMEIAEDTDLKEFKREMKDITEVRVPEFMRENFGVDIDVPLVGDVAVGPHWGAMKEI